MHDFEFFLSQVPFLGSIWMCLNSLPVKTFILGQNYQIKNYIMLFTLRLFIEYESEYILRSSNQILIRTAYLFIKTEDFRKAQNGI